MRVAVITRQIGHYHDARFRGAAQSLEDFVVIAIANEGAFAEFLAHDRGTYPVERLFDSRAIYDRAVRDGVVYSALSDKLDAVSPDVIAVAGWASPESFAAIRWAKRNGSALVMMSESQAIDAARSPIRETMKARVVQLCDAGFVGGPSHVDYMACLGMPRERIFLGYNAVGNEHFSVRAAKAREEPEGVRQRYGLPARYILASARFIEKKNLPGLVRAYARACEKIPQAPDLVILGDGEERGLIEATIEECRVSARVHLPGYRGYEDLPSYYALADAFVHVSLVEQWGLVINEAMASGTLVVASRPCGAARALIQDGVNGFLVDPADIEAMATTLTRAFDLDSAERAYLANEGARTIAAWGPSQFGCGLADAAGSALANRGQMGLAPWDAAILNLLSRRSLVKVA